MGQIYINFRKPNLKLFREASHFSFFIFNNIAIKRLRSFTKHQRNPVGIAQNFVQLEILI